MKLVCRWVYWFNHRVMEDGLQASSSSAVCAIRFSRGRVRFYCSARDFAEEERDTPWNTLTSLPGVLFLDGVINMKTTEFSLFSLPLKILLHFCHSFPMPFLSLLFSGVFRHWYALQCVQVSGSMVLLPLLVTRLDGHVIFKVPSSTDKHGLTKNRAGSVISKKLENGCERRNYHTYRKLCYHGKQDGQRRGLEDQIDDPGAAERFQTT